MKLEDLEKMKVDPCFDSVYVSIENAVRQLRSIESEGRAPDYKPDYPHKYDDPWHEACYVARYMFAYSYEYIKMYKDFLNMDAESDDINVISLGCGSMVDAWSLHSAIHSTRREISINYTGVDVVKWEERYIPKVTDFDSIQFVQDKAGNYLQCVEEQDFDIIVFPKSIGDICADAEDFKKILDFFRRIKKSRFFLAVSKITYNAASLRNDDSLLNSIVDVLMGSGITLNRKIERKGEDIAIAAGRSGYFYPELIDLNEVALLSGRKPIMMRKYENYAIYEFVKKDRDDTKR